MTTIKKAGRKQRIKSLLEKLRKAFKDVEAVGVESQSEPYHITDRPLLLITMPAYRRLKKQIAEELDELDREK